MKFLGDIDHLLETIEDVHKQHADDCCWMDADRIFVAAGLPVPDRSVGDKFAMVKNCVRFIDVKCSGGTWKSYAELEAENEQLRRELRDLQYSIAPGQVWVGDSP